MRSSSGSTDNAFRRFARGDVELKLKLPYPAPLARRLEQVAEACMTRE